LSLPHSGQTLAGSGASDGSGTGRVYRTRSGVQLSVAGVSFAARRRARRPAPHRRIRSR
jgi:hypothetical protein